MSNQPFFADYNAGYGIYKSVKDWLMSAVAAAGALAYLNLSGLAAQCPEATITVAGITITLKAALNFVNNWRKHNL